MVLGILAASAPSAGQQPAKVYRIGYMSFAVAPPSAERTANGCPVKGSSNWQAMVEGLRERGYVQGQNLVIECRSNEGREARSPAIAEEFVGLNVDLIVAASTANVRAARQATSTIPIVMVAVIDPAGRGLVANLARPGGNVTGPADDAGTQIAGKYLQLLKEIVPQLTRAAVLTYRLDTPENVFRAETEAAARALGVTLQYYELREPEKLDGAFADMTKARAEGLVVMPAPFMAAHARRIVELAAQARLPAVYPFREHAEAGGLVVYDINRAAVWRRIGHYVDRIFKGARPADLPVEQPADFDLILNLRTATTLGLTIPQTLLLRADEVNQ
jgi:putative ABC transport system substrate-binding protein